MSGSAMVSCGENATLSALPFCAAWTTDLTKDTAIAFDLETIPLQIKTDSAAGKY